MIHSLKRALVTRSFELDLRYRLPADNCTCQSRYRVTLWGCETLIRAFGWEGRVGCWVSSLTRFRIGKRGRQWLRRLKPVGSHLAQHRAGKAPICRLSTALSDWGHPMRPSHPEPTRPRDEELREESVRFTSGYERAIGDWEKTN